MNGPTVIVKLLRVQLGGPKYRCVLLIYVRLTVFIRRRTGPGTILSCCGGGAQRARIII